MGESDSAKKREYRESEVIRGVKISRILILSYIIYCNNDLYDEETWKAQKLNSFAIALFFDVSTVSGEANGVIKSFPSCRSALYPSMSHSHLMEPLHLGVSEYPVIRTLHHSRSYQNGALTSEH